MANDTAQATAALSKETVQQEVADLAKQKFDNITSSYENKISSNEQKKTSINNKISLAEAQGKQVSTAYYKALISAEKGEQSKLIKERTELQKSLDNAVANGSIKKGSDEWYEMVSAINEVTNAIDESTQALVEYQNTIRQLKWDAFDKSMETVKRINSESDYYINLMSHKDLVDEDTGNFTKYGTATLTLHQTNYDSYIAQAKAYQKEYNKIMKQVEKGELSLSDEEVVNRLRELQDAHRSAKESAEDELDSITDLVKQGYDAQIDALSDLIDQYKKLKDSELDAYNYEKSIIEKTKAIASLQKQLTIYGKNDDSEESRAQIQKLKVELQDAKDDLKDTQYQQFVSDTESMLDDLMDDYQEFIDEKLSDTNTLLSSIAELLGDNGSIISTLNSLDTSITTELKNLINGSTTASSYTTNTVKEDQASATEDADTSSYTVTEQTRINQQRKDLQSQIEQSEDTITSLQNELISLESQYKAQKKTAKSKALLAQLTQEYNIRSDSLHSQLVNEMNRLDMLKGQLDALPSYAKGSKSINKDGLVWTQDGGGEMIYRSSDGAVLTPVSHGDKIFTNEMSDNLWDWAKTNPAQMYAGQFTPVTPDFSKSVNNSSNIEVTFGDLVLPDVTNSAEFADSVESVMREAICRNGKTTQCITEAVSAKQLGKNGVGNARLYK